LTLALLVQFFLNVFREQYSSDKYLTVPCW